MSRELLVFEIDEATFAVPTSNVREVLRAAALFPLPEYPDLVEGGLNLRGEIVPVVDGRGILLRSRKPIDPADHMVVLQAQSQSLAIHVDRAVALTVIAENDIAEQSGQGKFIKQVVNSDHGPTAILNVDELIVACDPTLSPSSTGRES